MTEVIAAGPERRGIANGNIAILLLTFSIFFSFLSCLLSKSISIEIINRIIPPAILKAPNDILRYANRKFPTSEKNIKIIVAVKTPSKADFNFSFV